ncbi:hypothetical protein BTVI_99554 [Pitangus sulphuratus]|nr:hypothetical protein BTVI_99554 [Pitangus sulphuratus]
MSRSNQSGVRRHSFLREHQVGGTEGGDILKGLGVEPPSYTPHSITSPTFSTPHNVTLNTPLVQCNTTHGPMGHAQAFTSSQGHANFQQHGAAHVSGPKAYPSLPLPYTGTEALSSQHPQPPELPYRPAPTAEVQDLVPPTAFRQFSFKSQRFHQSISNIPTALEQQAPMKQHFTSKFISSGTQTTSEDNVTDAEENSEDVVTAPSITTILKAAKQRVITPTSKLICRKTTTVSSKTTMPTTPTPKLYNTKNISTSASDLSPSSVDAENPQIYTTTTAIQEPITPGPWIYITHHIVEAHERVWKSFQDQATLAGDLEMLQTFPVYKEEGKSPEWRPFSYPVMKM